MFKWGKGTGYARGWSGESRAIREHSNRAREGKAASLRRDHESEVSLEQINGEGSGCLVGGRNVKREKKSRTSL